MRHLPLARLLCGLSFRAGYPLGAPLLFGIFVVSSVIFGPTGMHASEVTSAMRASPLIALALWTGWLLLTLPVARLTLTPASAIYLRWLPAPRALFSLCFALITLLVEAPFVLLFLRGEGFISAIATALSALALHALFMTPFSSLRMRMVVTTLLVFVSIFAKPLYLALPCSFAAACLSVSSAIAKAPELGSSGQRGVLGRSPIGALAATHLLFVLRVEPAAIGRTLALTVLAALVFPMAVRGYDLETDASLASLVLGLAAAALPTGLSAIAAAVMRSERSASWLCDSNGLSPSSRAFAATLATSAASIVFGGLFSVAISLSIPGHNLFLFRAVPLVVAYALATAMVLSFGAREADVSPKRGDRAMVFALVWTALGVILASYWGQFSILFLCFVGISACLVSARRALVLRQQKGVS